MTVNEMKGQDAFETVTDLLGSKSGKLNLKAFKSLPGLYSFIFFNSIIILKHS